MIECRFDRGFVGVNDTINLESVSVCPSEVLRCLQGRVQSGSSCFDLLVWEKAVEVDAMSTASSDNSGPSEPCHTFYIPVPPDHLRIEQLPFPILRTKAEHQ